MEDAHTAVLQFDEDPDASFFAVFDGHGGMLCLFSTFIQQLELISRWFLIIKMIKITI